LWIQTLSSPSIVEKTYLLFTYHGINPMLGLQDNLASQKAAAETKDAAVEELPASGAHADLQVIQKGSKKQRYKENKRKDCTFQSTEAKQVDGWRIMIVNVMM